ncbi:STAS domain-containing protein [Streptomyces sp. NPDC057623]|uniref:STAS domain-containing protein n=1 Tax=Streptomyces sp. NPDC057623 TaxID=3346187 RepID=UPI0036AE1B06
MTSRTQQSAHSIGMPHQQAQCPPGHQPLQTFRITLQTRGPRHCLVSMAGELDIATAPEARGVLEQAVSQYEHITVDLSHLGFCDCAGLSALLGAARAARSKHAELRLRAPTTAVTRLLRLTRTRGAFRFEPPAGRDGHEYE